jgi:hypothetical protein|uniref:hypothetical protein n=1 Tax=Polynucleobacter sp. TaxID=2029855 RepID=UPI0040484DE0
MTKNYTVVNSFDNDEKNRCVDIVRDLEGNFGFQELRREPEDISGWFLIRDSSPIHFASEAEAIKGAQQAVKWFKVEI